MADMSMLLLCRSTIRAPELHSAVNISIRSRQFVEQEWAKHVAQKLRSKTALLDQAREDTEGVIFQGLKEGKQELTRNLLRLLLLLSIPTDKFHEISTPQLHFSINLSVVLLGFLLFESLDGIKRWWFFDFSTMENIGAEKPVLDLFVQNLHTSVVGFGVRSWPIHFSGVL